MSLFNVPKINTPFCSMYYIKLENHFLLYYLYFYTQLSTTDILKVFVTNLLNLQDYVTFLRLSKVRKNGNSCVYKNEHLNVIAVFWPFFYANYRNMEKHVVVKRYIRCSTKFICQLVSFDSSFVSCYKIINKL